VLLAIALRGKSFPRDACNFEAARRAAVDSRVGSGLSRVMDVIESS